MRAASIAALSVASALAFARAPDAAGTPPEARTDLREAAAAWYAAIDAGDEAKGRALYAGTDAAARWKKDVESYRGVPIELGSEHRAASDAAAWLPVHDGLGHDALVAWVRGERGDWRVDDVSDLAPELFLRSRFAGDVLWPTAASDDEDVPEARKALGAVFRLAGRQRDAEARRTQTERALDEEFFAPRRPEDRPAFAELLVRLADGSSLPTASAVVAARSGTVRLRAGDAFELGVVRDAKRWRISYATRSAIPPKRPSEDDVAAARDVATKALAALSAQDAKAYAEVSIDRSASAPTSPTVAGAKEAIDAIGRTFGHGIALDRTAPPGLLSESQVAIWARAPEARSDLRRVRLVLARVKGAWRVLDVGEAPRGASMEGTVPR